MSEPIQSASQPIPARAGIGLRFPHHSLAASGAAKADWFEVHAENYLHDAHARADLLAARRHYPISIHAVGLSPGSAHGVDIEHLARLAELVAAVQPELISDHLSWSAVPGTYLADLLPLPYNEEALDVVSRNVDVIQQRLNRPLLIENPSTYLHYDESPMSEARFLSRLVARTGCGVLLDINNIYVSASNRGWEPRAMLDEFLESLAAESIGEMHLAGHAIQQTSIGRTLRIDDHGAAVCADVWRLFERALKTLGPKPTLIEWDTRIPEFAVLVNEAAEAQWRLDALNRVSSRETSAHVVAH